MLFLFKMSYTTPIQEVPAAESPLAGRITYPITTSRCVVSCRMSDSEKELFGDPAESGGELSDAESVEEKREPIRKPANLKRYPPSHTSSKAWVSRVPAFLNLDPQPFDAAKFAGADKSSEELAMEANTVRWTYAANDAGDEDSGEKVKRVSNARIVEWSDGSRTLQLGNEHFEIKSHAQLEPAFICSQHDDVGLLATRQLVDETMSFLPTSTSSATHLMLARTLARKQESNQIRVGSVNTTEDPDKVQREIERTEQAKEKARRKLSAQREDIYSYSGRPTYTAASDASDDSMGEGEEPGRDDDDDGSDMDEDLDRHASRLNKIKHQNDEDEDESGDGDRAGGVHRRRVLEDDDESE